MARHHFSTACIINHRKQHYALDYTLLQLKPKPFHSRLNNITIFLTKWKDNRRVLPTSVLLQDPAFELYDRVSKGAAVLTLATVANFVTAHIELAERVQGTHLTVAHIGWPHHVHQAPAAKRSVQITESILYRGNKTGFLQYLSSLCFTREFEDFWQNEDTKTPLHSLIVVKRVSSCEVRADC